MVKSVAGSGSSGLHTQTAGVPVTVSVAGHPPRTDSPTYLKSRKWLMGEVNGGCFICDGPVDLAHPDSPANAKGMEDHHGGGIYMGGVLVALGLVPMEWSSIWGSRVEVVEAYRVVRNEVLQRLGQPTYDTPLRTTADVADFVDSPQNANVKLCHPHHVGRPTEHTPDHNGHEAVGIHECPFPILIGQLTWDWSQGSYFGDTTGTIAVAKNVPGVGMKPGEVMVEHVSAAHPPEDRLKVGMILPSNHPHAIAAHMAAGS